MPAIAAAVREALRDGGVQACLRRHEAERALVAAAAAPHLRGTVLTISYSSMVVETLLRARPRRVQVLVAGDRDEGRSLLGYLQRARLNAEPATLAQIQAEVAVTGCDALFADGGFVNRRGTLALVEAMDPKPVLVLAERWKLVDGLSPDEWPEPDLFEVIPPTWRCVSPIRPGVRT